MREGGTSNPGPYLNPMVTPMKKLVLLMALCGVLTIPAWGQEAGLTGGEIVDRYLATLDVDSELGFIRMNTMTMGLAEVEKRFLVLAKKEADGRRSYLMRLVRPRDLEGVTLLSTVSAGGEVEQYFYLPDVGRAKKVTGESRNTPFLGSDFTFEDILNEVPAAHEYTRLPDAVLGGKPHYAVQAKNKEPGTALAAFTRKLYFAPGTFHLVLVEFMNSQNRMVKRLTLEDYDSEQIKGESTRPRKATMENLEAKSSTVFLVVVGRINTKLDSRLFTPQSIESMTDDEVTDIIVDNTFVVEEKAP